MWKSCSSCGKIHDVKFKCKVSNFRPRERTEFDKLRNTSRWRKKRAEIRESQLQLCAVCNEQGRYTYENLEVHHITKLNEDPSKAFDNDNLICLCGEHHEMADRGELDADYLRELTARAED